MELEIKRLLLLLLLLKISSVNVTKSVNQETGDFVTFTEEFLDGKLNLLCGVIFKQFMTQ